MSIPSNLHYTADHEWVSIVADTATVGITQFAADALGDVVFVQLPTVGQKVVAGDACGEVESTKSVSDLYSPADGTVATVNDTVVDDPALLNTDPFGAGWLFTVTLTGTPDLLDPQAYAVLIETGSPE